TQRHVLRKKNGPNQFVERGMRQIHGHPRDDRVQVIKITRTRSFVSDRAVARHLLTNCSQLFSRNHLWGVHKNGVVVELCLDLCSTKLELADFDPKYSLLRESYNRGVYPHLIQCTVELRRHGSRDNLKLHPVSAPPPILLLPEIRWLALKFQIENHQTGRVKP